MHYTLFSKRSRWNGEIHICAIFRPHQEQVLLGNLLAGVTSASDHCSMGRYNFHSTTPAPSPTAILTHMVSFMTRGPQDVQRNPAVSRLTLWNDFTYLLLLSHSVHHVASASNWLHELCHEGVEWVIPQYLFDLRMNTTPTFHSALSTVMWTL